MYFKDIIGHEKIVENLISLTSSGKAGHAYIFSGPEGVGKKRTASAFASALLCSDFKEDSCGKCKNCHLTFGNAHPDFKIVDYSADKDGKTRASIPVDAMREFKNEVYLKPFLSERKIYILENCEKLTVEAQNALLKIFEEPPTYVTVILICNNLSKILSTIISRAVLINFSYLSSENVEIFLEKYYNETENKKIHARICGGSISRLIANIENPESLNFRNKVLDAFSELCLSTRPTAVNSLLSVFFDNKEKKNEIIEILSMIIFDCALYKTGNKSAIINTDRTDVITDISRNISIGAIHKAEEVISKLNRLLLSNVNYKLAVTESVISLKEEMYD